jgi:NAD(P)-dependent dehydrogenase (short-subunit alcohol dehydrogenase family)
MDKGSDMLAGKVAIVTGAGQGVGQGIALSLARHGAKVAVTGRTLSKVETTCKLIEERGGTALAIESDVTQLESLKKTVDEVLAHFGGIQILVNNAQQVPTGSLFEVTDEVFEVGWESGPFATFRMMKLCYPHLKGDGCIVNLASTSARRWDAANYGPYAATKEAVRALTRAAASEWGGDGIRTNVILPLAASPGLATWIEERPEESAAFLATVPLKRVGDCEKDIGEVVAFLCSDAASYVSGQSIAIDGGQAYMP